MLKQLLYIVCTGGSDVQLKRINYKKNRAYAIGKNTCRSGVPLDFPSKLPQCLAVNK